ncbi:MAG: methyltransferase [Gammaproteobacteria bacterium]
MIREDNARRLATLLGEAAPFWRPAPFYDDPPWVTELPALAGSLLSVADEHLERLDQHPEQLTGFVGEQLAAALDASQLARNCIDGFAGTPLTEPESLARDMPGRKRQQALHLAAAVSPQHAGELVDWCCGKAHLGRLLARVAGLPVTGIEWNETLVNEGNRLAERDRLAVRILAMDALAVSPADGPLRAGSHAVALHACGDLHVALLRAGSSAGIDGFTIAPCCYHRTRDTHWQPMSAALADAGSTGTRHSLRLARDELRLAVRETVTASARVALQSRQLAAWRLGFDSLQRELRGMNAPLPTPPRPARVLAAGFAAFCHDLAAHHGLTPPADTDFARHEAAGRQRLARVRRLELLRHAFRRPLEVLLVADRALFLAERGYRVRIVEFCPRALTPRNLAILATRAGG